MGKKRSDSLKLDAIVDAIVEAIDLNYILACAKRDNHCVQLVCGSLEKNLIWSNESCILSYNYKTATDLMYDFININFDRIIKIKISSSNYMHPYNQNIIIYVPYYMDLYNIRKEYNHSIDGSS